jgi:hypothetical protein
MNLDYSLQMTLLSDATFGRGDGVAGFVDQEVEHDAYGFPYLRGRTLKGLLSEECDNLIHSLPELDQTRWHRAAIQLFGVSGSTLETIAQMHMGDACLSMDLRQAIAYQIENPNPGDPTPLTREQVLASLTSIRRQTALEPDTGIPSKNSLRTTRVILRQLQFKAPLQFEKEPDSLQLTLLAVGALALRRVGSGRNRGRGQVECQLLHRGQDVTRHHATQFWEVAK